MRWLPSASTTNGIAAESDFTRPEHSLVGAASRQSSRPHARILLADDNADMREYVQRLLTQEGYEVDVTIDGQQALETARTRRPDLAVIDVMMPRLDGSALLKALRTDERTATVPIIMLSARAGEEARIEGLNAGADDYLIKPFSARELLARVGAHLEMARIRAQAEESLLESQSQLQEADRRKDEFLAMLAHELRNPLAPIRTGLEVIRRARDIPPSVERVRVTMERQVGHIVRLIDDLLDVSRITSGKIQLQRKRTLLADLVTNAVDANREAFDVAQVQLRVQLPGEPCVLDVDPTRLIQVLSNLLHNASKFTPPGGIVTVTATCRSPHEADGHGHVVIAVTDSGIGIAQDMLPRVFELFTQAAQLGDGRQPGLGIGLTLARRLVEMHGGRLEAASDGLGHGSSFTVTIPIADELDAAAPLDDVKAAPMVARRVMVIDDNVDAARMMAMLIDVLGSESLVANDGAAGISALDQFRPDVVLLDIGMPDMDGYETCRRLRKEPAGAGAFIVAVTGWGQEQDKRRAVDAGFDAHLTKPADPAILEQLLAASRGARRSDQ